MRPCACDREACRLCWLYRHDERYRALWDGQVDGPSKKRTALCVHVGPVRDRLGCPCLRKWLRGCDVHGTCTLETCAACPDYEPDE
jgi:hypothetical protein